LPPFLPLPRRYPQGDETFGGWRSGAIAELASRTVPSVSTQPSNQETGSDSGGQGKAGGGDDGDDGDDDNGNDNDNDNGGNNNKGPGRGG